MPKPTTKTKSQTPPEPIDPTTLPILRQIEGQPVTRSLSVERETIDEENRTVEMSATSEYPVQRWFGMEVLDHSQGAIDWSRMRSGAPLLAQHDRWSTKGQIGVVEEAWLDDDRRMRVRVRFSKGKEAEEIWRDVVDGIRRNVSCGYLPQEMVLERREGDLEHFRVTRWQPFEISIVSVAADPTVGIGRSTDQTTSTITIRGSEMPKPNENTNTTTTTTTEPSGNSGGEHQEPTTRTYAEPKDTALEKERQRSADILALGERFNQRDLALQSVTQGISVDSFRAQVLERQHPTPINTNPGESQRDLPQFNHQKPGQDVEKLGITERDMSRFSLLRAINAMATGDYKDAGFEREVSNAIADECGTEARGLYMPHQALFSNGQLRQQEKATPAKGGVLVDTDLRTDMYTEILKNLTVLGSMGATVLSGLQGDVDIPKQLSEGNFFWLDEDGEAPLSDIDFGTIGLSPKTISGAIAITRRLRKQSSMSIENLVRNELLSGVAVTTDKGYLYGTGEDNQPLGLMYQTGVPGLTYDDKFGWDDAVDMETQVGQANVSANGMGYLTSVGQRGAGKKSFVAPGTAERLWHNNEVNGYRAVASNQVNPDTWVFGDWAQVMIALWGVVDLKVDTSTKAASDGLILRIFQDVDVNARRKEAFSIARKAAVAP